MESIDIKNNHNHNESIHQMNISELEKIFPRPLVRYIQRAENDKDKKYRIKTSHNIIGKSPTYKDISRIMSDWIKEQLQAYERCNIDPNKKQLYVLHSMIICIDVLDNNYDFDKFMDHIGLILADYPNISKYILQVYPEFTEKFNTIIAEKDTLWFKINHYNLAPLFGGRGCVIL